MKAPNFYAASYLILKHEGKILLQRRSKNVWRAGMYGLPAGHIENKESVFAAMAREIKEELDITVKEKDVELVHIMHRVSEDRVYFDFFYTGEKWTGTVRNVEPEKHDEVAWFPLGNLPKDLIPYLGRALERIEKGILFSEDES